MDQESKAPSHVLWGAEQIAREIGRNRRQTFYLLESGQIPARKAGRNWFITKSALRAWLAGDTDTNKSRFAANSTYDSVQEAIDATARFYRKSLWADAEAYVEVWCEKDALAGVILPITSKYDVPLMVARGYSSETFCYEAIAARDGDDRDYYVYYLGDFDRSGRDAANALKEKLTRFAEEDGIEVIFKQIAVTRSQVEAWSLPTRPHKRVSPADKKWPHAFLRARRHRARPHAPHGREGDQRSHRSRATGRADGGGGIRAKDFESVRPSREAAITRGRVALAAKLSTARLTKSARFGWWRTKGSQQHDS